VLKASCIVVSAARSHILLYVIGPHGKISQFVSCLYASRCYFALMLDHTLQECLSDEHCKDCSCRFSADFVLLSSIKSLNVKIADLFETFFTYVVENKLIQCKYFAGCNCELSNNNGF
jgi:hypothetical protein